MWWIIGHTSIVIECGKPEETHSQRPVDPWVLTFDPRKPTKEEHTSKMGTLSFVPILIHPLLKTSLTFFNVIKFQVLVDFKNIYFRQFIKRLLEDKIFC